MTQKEAKELLPIIQAIAEGKTIQCKWNDGTWVDINKEDFDNLLRLMKYQQDLRIKPESKYRPFVTNKECLEEMLKHQPFGWVKEDVDYCDIVHIGRYGINLNTGVGNDYYNYKKAFNLKFIDGTPFGIKED